MATIKISQESFNGFIYNRHVIGYDGHDGYDEEEIIVE